MNCNSMKMTAAVNFNPLSTKQYLSDLKIPFRTAQ